MKLKYNFKNYKKSSYIAINLRNIKVQQTIKFTTVFTREKQNHEDLH